MTKTGLFSSSPPNFKLPRRNLTQKPTPGDSTFATAQFVVGMVMLRSLLSGWVACLMGFAFANDHDWTPLWPGTAPGAPQPVAGTEIIKNNCLWSNVEVPQYRTFLPDKPNGTSVVIFPGGGYQFVSFRNEGLRAAKELKAMGIAAMVVKYRVAGDDSLGYQFPVPLLDARRAVRTMKHLAAEAGLDPKKVGVMGFSAGGHLAAMAATFQGKLAAETTDAIDQLNPAPAFAVLAYPVIGIGKKWGHGGSTRRLLGESPTDQAIAAADPLQHLSKETPPVFLIHCADDNPVPLRNSLEFAQACRNHKVPVGIKVFPFGGHGFGAPGNKHTDGWLQELPAFLKSQKL